MSPLRWILTVSAVLGLAAAPMAQAGTVDVGVDVDAAETRLAIDLTGEDLQTTVIAPADLAAPEQAVGVGPGTHLLIEIPNEGTFGCTANFVWADGNDLYLGSAGHCFLPPKETATHGEKQDNYKASGVKVFACVSNCTNGGFSGFLVSGELVELGKIAYARQAESGDDDGDGFEDEQVGFDFGVVEIPDGVDVRPSMPVFDGPTTSGTLQIGDVVCHYGNGVVFGEVFPTMGRAGVGLLSDDGAFFFEGAGSFGDSGSAVQTCVPTTADGLHGEAAIGVFTHLTLIGLAGTTVDQAVAMAAEDTNLDLQLVLGPVTNDGGDSSSQTDDGGNGGPPEGKGPKG